MGTFRQGKLGWNDPPSKPLHVVPLFCLVGGRKSNVRQRRGT